MTIFDIFLSFVKKRKTIDELFLDIETAFNELLKLCNQQEFSEGVIEDIRAFIVNKLRRLNLFKTRYPNVDILSLRTWIDSTRADLEYIEELFESMEDKRKRKMGIATFNRVISSLDALGEVLPAIRRVA